MNYKVTLRRRSPDGSLQTATYKLEHLHSSGGDEEQMLLLVDMEMQANGGWQDSGRNQVRVWVEEIE